MIYILLATLIVCHAAADGLHDRAKRQRWYWGGVNWTLELSRLFRAGMVVCVFWALAIGGFEWWHFLVYCGMNYVLFNAVRNLAAGDPVLYLGTGIWDTVVKIATGGNWGYVGSVFFVGVILLNQIIKKTTS